MSENQILFSLEPKMEGMIAYVERMYSKQQDSLDMNIQRKGEYLKGCLEIHGVFFYYKKLFSDTVKKEEKSADEIVDKLSNILLQIEFLIGRGYRS